MKKCDPDDVTEAAAFEAAVRHRKATAGERLYTGNDRNPAETGRGTVGQIIGYDCHLETVSYKPVHDTGFRFGDRFLKIVVPEYVPDFTVTEMYGRMLETVIYSLVRQLLDHKYIEPMKHGARSESR